MLSTALALLLFGAAGGERGAAGLPPEEVPAARTDPRVHAGIALGGVFAVGGYSVTAAALLAADIGVVLRDRVSLVARLEGGTVFLSGVAGFSLLGALHLDEHWSVGIGAKLFGWLPIVHDVTRSPFLGLWLPMRVSWAPFASRPVGQVPRTGFVLGLEAAPGIGVLSTGFSPFGKPVDGEFGFSASVTAGYAVW